MKKITKQPYRKIYYLGETEKYAIWDYSIDYYMFSHNYENFYCSDYWYSATIYKQHKMFNILFKRF